MQHLAVCLGAARSLDEKTFDDALGLQTSLTPIRSVRPGLAPAEQRTNANFLSC